ncbi:MAG: hypothetical protein JJT88_16320 [Gammaproteobacteria bacterium]|nr:hypothetical protein [Gammaproteobacteria bacterium]
MQKFMKFLHTAGAVGITGAIAAHLVLLSVLSQLDTLAEIAALRAGIAAVATWLLLPSLVLVLVSGLLAIAAHPQFGNAGWVWVKVALGLAIFEGTLVSVQRPAARNLEYTLEALAGEISSAELAGLLHSEWGPLWVILAICLANIVLGIWRPRIGRRRQPKDAALSRAA